MTIKIVLPIIFFVTGLLFASFSNMLMYRFANNKPIIKDTRSYCPKCHHTLAWYDNIPLLSYLLLKGKCRYCHQKISPRYLLVELFGGVFFVAFYYLYACVYPTKSFELSTNVYDLVNAITIAFTMLFLLVSAYVDKKSKEVPISMMVTMLLLAITNFVFLWVYEGFNLNHLLSFVGPAAFLLIIYIVCVLLLKVEPIGIADIIIFSILGLLGGAVNLLTIVLFSSLICSIVELIKIKKTGEKKEFPFVPYIFIGTMISFLFTPLIVEGIEKLIGGLI